MELTEIYEAHFPDSRNGVLERSKKCVQRTHNGTARGECSSSPNPLLSLGESKTTNRHASQDHNPTPCSAPVPCRAKQMLSKISPIRGSETIPSWTSNPRI